MNRDGRIYEELKLLESFDNSIATVLEKNKSVLSHNNINTKVCY